MTRGIGSDGGGRRDVEVRPTWSDREWSQLVKAAESAGMVPAAWCAAVVSAAVAAAPGPQRCTTRQLLWSRVLAEWETVFWSVLAAKPAAPDPAWDVMADAVRTGGAVIAAEARTTGTVERAHAREAVAVAAVLVEQLAPGARRSQSALSALIDGKRGRGHRSKVMLDGPTHQAVVEVAARRGWTLSDYVGALAATTAVLALADTRAHAEVAQLRECLEVVTRAARRAVHLHTQPQPVGGAAWREVGSHLDKTRRLVEQARTIRGHDVPELDLRSLLPDAFVILGWPTPWPAPEPQREPVS